MKFPTLSFLRWRRFGLRERILIGLSFGAFVSIVITAVAWISFERVAESQRNLIETILPVTDALHDIARHNARLSALAQHLGQAPTIEQLHNSQITIEAEIHWIEKKLQLFSASSPQRAHALDDTRQHLATAVAQLSSNTQQRLHMRQQNFQQIRALQETMTQVEQITQTQAENASAALVASMAAIYDATQHTHSGKAQHTAAFNKLLDFDLDTLERMHQFILTANTLRTLIDQLHQFDAIAPLDKARTTFIHTLMLLQRRSRDIANPEVRRQALELQTQLQAALAPNHAFDASRHIIRLRQKSLLQHQHILTLCAQMDEQINGWTHSNGQKLAEAALTAEQTTSTGILAFSAIASALLLITGFVITYMLRRHTLSRLAALERATLALAQGQRDVDIDLSGKDELLPLAHALSRFRDDAIERDQLSLRLQQQQQILEQVVEARTAALRTSNLALAHEIEEHSRAREQAERANRAKTAFLGSVSHELRTPLTGILGSLELMQHNTPSATQMAYIEQTRTAATLLQELLEDMLDFARIESGQLCIDNTDFNLRKTIKDIFAVQGMRAAARGLALALDAAADVPDRLYGDRRKLSQILLNLIGNAIKYSDQGVITVQVTMIAPHNPPVPRLCFKIIDHGIGIATEHQQSIFEPFIQVRDHNRHHGGTGLGLAICQRLVHTMQGDISLQSTPGLGTTVQVILDFELGTPVRTDNNYQLPSLHSAHQILLLEDDDISRMVIGGFLQSLGQRYNSASNAQTALEIMAEQNAPPVEFALIDINLPDMNGIDALQQLRAHQPQPVFKAVAMSAHINTHDQQQLLVSGFDAFLAKPFDSQQLAQTFFQLLQPPASSHKVLAPTQTHDKSIAATELAADTLLDYDFLQHERAVLGVENLKTVIDVFIQQGKQIVQQLQHAVTQQNSADCCQCVHKLGGSAANLGLDALRHTCITAEKMFKTSALPPNALQAEAQKIADLFQLSCHTLECYIEQHM